MSKPSHWFEASGREFLSRLKAWLEKGPRAVQPPGEGRRTAPDFYAVTAIPAIPILPPVHQGHFWPFMFFKTKKNNGLFLESQIE